MGEKPRYTEKFICLTCSCLDTVALLIDGKNGASLRWCANGHVIYVENGNGQEIFNTSTEKGRI